MATADIRHTRARCQLWYHAIQGREPGGNKILQIARSEKPGDCAKQAASKVTPCDTAAITKCRLYLGLSLRPGGDTVERSQHRDRAVLDGEEHGLLLRQSELSAPW